MLKLISFQVKGLLGRFDHHVRFDPDWDFVIIHGPNGVGKTKLLEIIHGLTSARFEKLLYMPFAYARLAYDDGTTLSAAPVMAPEGTDVDRQLRVQLTRPGQPPLPFIVSPADEAMQAKQVSTLERHLPVERTGPHQWWDAELGAYLTTADIIERYRDYLPTDFSGIHELEESAFDHYRAFLESVPVHLIETQRLLTAGSSHRRRAHGRRSASPMTVTRYSEDLTHRLNSALADNSTTSQ